MNDSAYIIDNKFRKSQNMSEQNKQSNNQIDRFVLRHLEANSGKWISGADLAEQVNVSRNTIWRIIKKLQDTGYAIESVTGRGYQLKNDQDLLSEYGIILNLNNPSNYQIEILGTVDSTNNILKEKARAGYPAGTLIVANAQESGRGRRGRDFFSPPGTGVYFSLLIRPDHNFNPGQKSPALAAVALSSAIDKILDKTSGIKWVNDIYLDQKKVAGILSEAELDFETASIAYLVIGVGVNVYQPQTDFPSELKHTASALLPSTQPKAGLRNKLIAEFLNQWEILAKPEQSMQALEIFRSKSILTGKTVNIWHNHNKIVTKVLDVNQEFELVVELKDGSIQTINHGEATLHSN
jgi:BirA family biotin operon repressor/biotin-[acetyl-CoA-carboxylase] ligase